MIRSSASTLFGLLVVLVIVWLQSAPFFTSAPTSAPSFAEMPARAEQGDAAAQYELGRMYELGCGGASQDYTEATKWYQKSAEQGYAAAEVMFGSMYEGGYGRLPKDHLKAREWEIKAAEQGNTLGKVVLFLDNSGIATFAQTLPQWARDTFFLSIIVIIGLTVFTTCVLLIVAIRRTGAAVRSK